MPRALVYSSRAARPMSPEDLMDLLEEARAHNAAHAITGLLLHEDGTFLQLLEGEKRTVTDLYDRIRVDPRHRDVRTVWVSAGAERHFTDWSMAFADFSDTVVEHPAFSDLLTTRTTLGTGTDRRADLLTALESTLA